MLPRLSVLVVGLTFSLGSGCGEPTVAGSDGVELAAPADSPSRFGPVPAFELTDQDGREFGLDDLRGEPFVAAAIFTTCAGPCPKITASMRRLQEELRDTGVRLVSISVDPEHDRPEVLAAYANAWTADGERWRFLTGTQPAVYELVQKGFWLAAQEDPGAPQGFQVTHRTSIVAVDRHGERRGWYEGTDAKAVDLLIARMRFLDGE